MFTPPHEHHGGPAFPSSDPGRANPYSSGSMTYFGMSLRDYFAGQALASALAVGHTAKEAAERAYTIADAMLSERQPKAVAVEPPPAAKCRHERRVHDAYRQVIKCSDCGHEGHERARYLGEYQL